MNLYQYIHKRVTMVAGIVRVNRHVADNSAPSGSGQSPGLNSIRAVVVDATSIVSFVDLIILSELFDCCFWHLELQRENKLEV